MDTTGSIGQNARHHEQQIKVPDIPCEQRSSAGIFTSMTMSDGRVVNISAGKPKD
jgi:hypothetical protein